MRALNVLERLLIALVLSSVCGTTAFAAEPEQIPLIGSEGPAEDACIGVGTITTLAEHLPVRERPEKRARAKDQLAPSTLVWICEKRAGAYEPGGAEDWQGIVYPSGEFQKLGDCQVSRTVAAPEPYAGPCKFGWVLARELRLVLL